MAHPRPPLTAAALALALSAGCGPPAPTTGIAAPTPAPVGPPPAADLTDGAAGAFHSARFNMTLPLPDGSGWRIDDHATSWLVANHAASSSSLLVRAWREDENMNRERCEARARAIRKLPVREGAEMVERRAIDVPEGFDTIVEIGVVPGAPGRGLGAFAMAFGGWAKKCFAYVFVTTVSGADAEEVVGRRLATMVQRSLGRLAIESDLAPSIPRDPTR